MAAIEAAVHAFFLSRSGRGTIFRLGGAIFVLADGYPKNEHLDTKSETLHADHVRFTIEI